MKNSKSSILIGFILLCLTLPSTPGRGQVILSLIFGDELNSEKNLFGIHLSGSTNHFSNFPDTQDLRAFNLGLFFTHKFNEKYMLNFDLLAKYQRGVKGIPFYDSGNEDINGIFEGKTGARRINYLSIPVSFRYLASERLFFEAGPQISMRTKAWDVFETEIADDPIEYRHDIRDQVSRFDLGYLAGIGLIIGKDKINALGIRHQKGFTDTLNEQEGSQKHSQWSIYANLPIGRGKMKTK